ncbi:hypothetical protein TVNIR_3361 [Thioalkalivibrio nitratireducens DSM 14787]|uniref:Uncharacterized protein n=1 Tax=Thioalkalivibrio nitratireducens (strain DSM 14787 / UNIQEM 213 / ALEN2) TaxID=1255043 RepID=L0E126_THIND|nr:hypothetical protein [Thioalkalivibrio nitratireducens]AGA34998.1 hypothetical protein TVNIR_3361 [Thioalkalivibrio nitratireducens DSM 14787]
MEFFSTAHVRVDAEALQRELTIERLPQWCASVDTVLESIGDHGRIYCVWGEFAVHREAIRGGVRFTLPGCPNALAWTVTTDLPPDRATVVIHCTINRREHDPDFVETIEAFVEDWHLGLEAGLPDPTGLAQDRGIAPNVPRG